MEWMPRLVGPGIEGQSLSFDAMSIRQPDWLGVIGNLGMTMTKAKQLLAQVQKQVVAARVDTHAMFRPTCRSCGLTCLLTDWQPHRIATLFGKVRQKLPRFCAPVMVGETGVSWSSHCRSVPMLGQLQARLSALMPYRVAADVYCLLLHLLPIDAGKNAGTLRSHRLRVGKRLANAVAENPPTAATITVTLAPTFIRSCEGGERRSKVRVGNVETVDGGGQVLAPSPEQKMTSSC